MKRNDLILCAACKNKHAVQFVSMTIKRITGSVEQCQHINLWLCAECAKRVRANMASIHRMAETLVGAKA